MKIIDPGHLYELNQLDGSSVEYLRFVKREGSKYPGNHGHYPGTNVQEVVRAIIARIIYVDNQIHDPRNLLVIDNARSILRQLERRAAERHGRKMPNLDGAIEFAPVCRHCGHIGCDSDHK